MTERIPLGVKRLDDLLEGGVRRKSTTLCFGPPYSGKEVLARLFLLTGLRNGTPGVVVLTDQSAEEFSASMSSIWEDYGGYEKEGLVHYLDMYAWMIGASGERHPNTEYVEGPTDLNAALMSVNTLEREILREHPHHRLLFDSVSTLVVHSNAQTAFRFLQLFLGRTRNAGATSFLMLERGVHTEGDVELVKHLTDGIMELRRDEGKNQLRVEGFGVQGPEGWVDYKASDRAFELTGSFAAGRIR